MIEKTPALENAEAYFGQEVSPELWKDFQEGITTTRGNVRAQIPGREED